MLCEECYKKILMGNAREVFESCREIDEDVVESNILDLVMLKVDNLQRTRYRNEEKQINRELVDYEPECECKCRNILLIS